MSEEITPTPKISVSFERKISDGDYGTITASAFVTYPMDTDANSAVISEKLEEGFQQCKAVVFDELGIEVEIDATSGMITEVPKVRATKVAAPAAGGGAPRPGSFDTKTLKVMNEKDMVEDIPDWLVTECARMGIEAVWANQGKYGTFYKEAVKAGETPIHMNEETGKAAIISKPK